MFAALPFLKKYITSSIIPSILPTIINSNLNSQNFPKIENNPQDFNNFRKRYGKLDAVDFTNFDKLSHFANSSTVFRINLLETRISHSIVLSPSTVLINRDCRNRCICIAVTPHSDMEIFYSTDKRPCDRDQEHDINNYGEKCKICRINCANGYFGCMHSGYCIPCLFRLQQCPKCEKSLLGIHRITLTRTDVFKNKPIVCQPCGHLTSNYQEEKICLMCFETIICRNLLEF